MQAFLGLDDTDNKDSRGTGHLARVIGQQLSEKYKVVGITRHQLFFDPRVPYTAKNSSAAILLEIEKPEFLIDIFNETRAIMLADFQPGSDPGLCAALRVPAAVTAFGEKAKVDLVTQALAISLAKESGILLEGLGGTRDGVIGALSAVGLAAAGNDGRYIFTGQVRELHGSHNVEEVLAAGIAEVRTLTGEVITHGSILTDKLRPSRRDGKVVLFVEEGTDGWLPIKLD
jgi:tRNA(Ile2) C34 agmatinyltransferase TiaS